MVVALPLMTEAGYRVYGWLKNMRHPIGTQPRSEDITQFVGGALMLVSLLLGFTVTSASDRFEARREMIAGEANEITTTYLRSQLFAEPVRSRLTEFVKQYARHRQEMIKSFGDTAKESRAADAVESDQRLLWQATIEALSQTGSEAVRAQFLVSMNGMLDSADFTYSAMEAKTPPKIAAIIAVFSLLAAALVGYQLGAIEKRYPFVSTVVFLMFAITIMLIVDLDDPGAGFIGVGTAPLQRATDWMSRSEAVRIEPRSAPPAGMHRE